MSGRLEGKVALVTGAGRGIGRTLVRRDSPPRARSCTSTILEDPREVLAELPESRRGLALAFDVASPPSDRQAHRRPRAARYPRQLRRHPRLDEPRRPQRGHLGGGLGPRHRHEPEGDVLLLRRGGAADAGRRGGSIVNVSSVVAAGACAISPRTRRARAESTRSRSSWPLSWRRTRSASTPSPPAPRTCSATSTTIRRTARPGLRLIPLGRIAEPEDMVGPTVFLASEESAHVTGQLFYVDGGWTSVGRVPEGYVDLAERQQHRER